MEISELRVGAVAVVALRGRIDSAGTPALRERLTALIQDGATSLVIDFAGVAYISSAGFRALLIAAKQVEEASGRIALCAVGADLRRLFEIAAFDSLFSMLPNREEALAVVSGV